MVLRDVLATGRRLGIIALGLTVGLLSASSSFAQAPQAAPVANQRLFNADGALWLHFIQTEKVADFEGVLEKLKEALEKSEKPERKQQLQSWKMYKSPDASGPNTIYIMVIDPALKGTDYSISNIIQEGFPPAEANVILTTYAGSYSKTPPAQNILNINVLK